MRREARWPVAPRRVALLGGSFNPAHEGHVAASIAALKALRVDAVWWLVTPQNPLKAEAPAPLAERMASAQAAIGRRRKLKAMALECATGTQFTVDTIRRLRKHYPQTQFFWLMGADNLAQFHRWQGWREIVETVPVLVLDRAPYSHATLHAKAAVALKGLRRRSDAALRRAEGGWAMRRMRRHRASSTAIREKGKA